MKHNFWPVLVFFAAGTIAPTAFAGKTISFEAAAAMATNTKSCAKKQVDKIAKVTVMSDPFPGMKGIYLNICDEACPVSQMIGPLTAKPTAKQLASLTGKSFCVPLD